MKLSTKKETCLSELQTLFKVRYWATRKGISQAKCSDTQFICLSISWLSPLKLSVFYSLVRNTIYKINDVCACIIKRIVLSCILSKMNRLMYWTTQSMYYYEILGALLFFIQQFIPQFRLLFVLSTQNDCINTRGSRLVIDWLLSVN